MSDTIGDMIDKLTIANIRLWHIEDERREFCANREAQDQCTSEHAEQECKKLDGEIAKKYLNMISTVNKERNSLIDQINASLRVLIDKIAKKNSSFSLTAEELLGTGKNKFYKEEKNNV